MRKCTFFEKKIQTNTPFVNYKFISSEMVLREVEYKSHFVTIGQKRVTCRTVGFGSPPFTEGANGAFPVATAHVYCAGNVRGSIKGWRVSYRPAVTEPTDMYFRSTTAT
jgi:hypothetical protein